jgi:hypothetical protein
MPVERIVKYFTENGFELNKATAHGLIKKSAGLMDRLDDVLHTAILEDDSFVWMKVTIPSLQREKQGW